jgi:two-component system response regulator
MQSESELPIKPIVILMAEDDEDDQLLTKEALTESRIVNHLYFVNDGVELLDYLRRKGKYANRDNSSSPDLILLDLNLPRMDGREALKEIKSDPMLSRIPVVILTTSQDEEDIARSYSLGASGFITKPVTFSSLVKTMKVLGEYWIAVVKRPNNNQY